MFWFSGPKACGILLIPPGMEPEPLALDGGILTTGPPGESPTLRLLGGGECEHLRTAPLQF